MCRPLTGLRARWARRLLQRSSAMVTAGARRCFLAADASLSGLAARSKACTRIHARWLRDGRGAAPSSRGRAPCSRLLHRLPPPQVRAPSTLSCICKSCRFFRVQAHVSRAASLWSGAAVGSHARSCGHATSRVVRKHARGCCQHAACSCHLLLTRKQPHALGCPPALRGHAGLRMVSA